MPNEPLLSWSDPVKELISFLALFLAAGAIGFRFSALRRARVEADRPLYDDAASRAARLGAVGALVSLIALAVALPGLASRKHLGVVAFVSSDISTLIQVSCLVLAVIGFVLAASRYSAGWVAAAIGVIVGALRAGLLGQWSRLVNPIHSLAAGLWIGTLFVLVVVGLGSLVRYEQGRDRRATIAADMINAFSPLALSMGAVVVCFGLITAWRHLHVLSNLWSTAYGYALMVKLALAAMVFALGAWNWRRQRPLLGTDEAASSIRRSATSELVVAALVLVATAVVVSLPAPKG